MRERDPLHYDEIDSILEVIQHHQKLVEIEQLVKLVRAELWNTYQLHRAGIRLVERR